MGSEGITRFVVLVDLIRKTAEEMKKPALREGPESDNGPKSDDGPEFDDELGTGKKSLPAQPFPESNKRAAEETGDSPVINKRTRTLSPDRPESPTLPALQPNTPYSRATVTVFTTRVIVTPNGKKVCTMEKLIDEAECWPTLPAPDVCFSFSWDDMNVVDYPVELRDCKFTIRFEWLDALLYRAFGVFEGFPKMRDDSDDVECEEELDSDDSAMEMERLWAVKAKVESGKIESDDSWK